MPLIEISDEQAVQGVNALRPEMRALLEDKEVPIPVQALLGHLGVTQIETYANLESDETALRELISTELGLAAADGMKARVTISQLVATWQAARTRNKAVDAIDADRKAAGLPKELTPEMGKSIRSAHEKVYGEVEDY